MGAPVSGNRNPKEELGQSASVEKGIQSSVASVYLSSEEKTLGDNKSGLSLVNKSSEECYEYLCDSCNTAGDHYEAEGFCNDCNEYLCKTCFRSHSRNKTSKYHILLSKDDMPRSSSKVCNQCKIAGFEIKAVGFCKDGCNFLCNDCYGDHPRNELTRHHVIVKDEAFVEVDHDVTPSISKMKVTEKMTSGVNTNEEYTFIQDVNVKSDTDEKDCFVTGMTLVSDNGLVLCDHYNKCLKLVDINQSIIKDVLALQAKPGGITTISNDQIGVVLLDNSCKIQLVNVSAKMTLDRSIKTNGICVDVKMINNQLYVSFSNPVKFQKLQLTGAIIKTINPDDEILKHCKLPWHIAVSHDERVIYVSDFETCKVMSLDINGNMLALYQAELEGPHGIIISQSGSVYVCNRNQNIVYKMMSDLNKAMVILGPGDGLLLPQAMYLNNKNQHLYISTGSIKGKYKNILKVYKC
jgi:hypothetical protein